MNCDESSKSAFHRCELQRFRYIKRRLEGCPASLVCRAIDLTPARRLLRAVNRPVAGLVSAITMHRDARHERLVLQLRMPGSWQQSINACFELISPSMPSASNLGILHPTSVGICSSKHV